MAIHKHVLAKINDGGRASSPVCRAVTRIPFRLLVVLVVVRPFGRVSRYCDFPEHLNGSSFTADGEVPTLAHEDFALTDEFAGINREGSR